jgi:hypothetical protein
MIMKRRRVAGEMAVAVVLWSRADVYVTDYDNLPSFTDQCIDAFLEHKVIIHLERETGIRRFVWAIDVDEDEKTKVEHKGSSFRIKIGKCVVVAIRH